MTDSAGSGGDHNRYSAKVADVSRACAHRWRLDQANGSPVVDGTCSLCGAVRAFTVTHRHDLGPLWRDPARATSPGAPTPRPKGGSRSRTDA